MQAVTRRVLLSPEAPTAGCRRVALAGLPAETRQAMVRLAARACDGLDAEAYLADRLRRYGSAALLEEPHGELTAFVLVDEFSDGGERFFYLGPLFSCGGACVQLVAGFVAMMLREHRHTSVHFAAELQSAEALLLFKRLFLRT